MTSIGIAAGLAALGAAAGGAETARGERAVEPYVSTRISLEIADANQFEYENGLGGILAGGVKFRKNWRADYAFSRRTTDIDGIPPPRAEGAHSTWSHLFNVYYHPFGVDALISPFVGLGGGFNITKLRARSVDPDPALNGLGFPAQRHVTKALQGQAGVAIKVTRRVAVEAAGVYFTSDDRLYESTFANNPTVEAAYRTYSGQIGVRVSL